jgi:carbon monoxide dehydrogenase subunit G
MRLEITREVDAPREVLWRVLTRWEQQSDWMLDAESVEVLTPERTGEGVVLRCPTNVLGVTVEDVMRVSGWEEPTYLEVTHLGRVITGHGAFVLEPLGAGRTRITWWEEIDPPFGAVGEWGASRVVRPVLAVVFGRSLARLAALAEAEAAGPPHGAT